MVDNHGHRLTDLTFFVPRFPMYNAAIRWRIVTKNGDQLPPEGELCMSFLDRVSCRIYCPSGPWFWQRLWWNFKSKFHCLAYEAMTFPDGIAGFVYGSMIGRHNDNYILNESALDEILEEVQMGNETKYWTYTDRGYTSKEYIRAAYHGPNVTLFEQVCNLIMGCCRVGVEWFFGKLKSRSGVMRDLDNMKVNMTQVDYHVKSGCLLTNTHTFLYGSNASLHFECLPSQLEEYFRH
jgi:hypothetical protein